MVGVPEALSDQAVYTFFRLGLVSGLVPRQAVFAWVDQQILSRPLPSEALIELTLAEKLTYSQVAHLLNVYQEGADIDLPAKMLLAQAGHLLHKDDTCAERLIQALSLLNAEYFLSKELRAGITSLDACRQDFKQGKLTQVHLVKCLRDYLRRFSSYGGLVRMVLDGRVDNVGGGI